MMPRSGLREEVGRQSHRVRLRGRDERLVRDTDASPELPSDESYKASSAPQLQDVLAFKISPSCDVACQDLRHQDGAFKQTLTPRTARMQLTSPAGHAIPPHPGDASTASLIATRPTSGVAANASSIV